MINTTTLDPRKTARVEYGSNSPVAHPVTPEPKLQPTRVSPQARPWRLLVHIGTDSATSVGIEVTNEALIGRADQVEGHAPTLDLAPHGGRDSGVSRRLALIFAAENGLFIRDLSSTNGTLLNGYLLKANQPYQLRDGDSLDIGQVHMRVKIVYPATPSY